MLQSWAKAIASGATALPKKEPIVIRAHPVKSFATKPMHQQTDSAEPEVKTKSVLESVVDEVMGEAPADRIPPPLLVPEHASPESIPGAATKKILLKHWPRNRFELVDYNELVEPIKRLLDAGYIFKRKLQKSFDYDGYEIGAPELQHCPSNKHRFSEASLAKEKERTDRNLIDVALNVMYLLGIENGRRAERRYEQPVNSLVETLSFYRETNRDLRLRNDELEAEIDVLRNNATASYAEVRSGIRERVREKAASRAEAFRLDLSCDASRNNYDAPSPRKRPFNELVSIGQNLSCSREDWTLVLEKNGWTYDEFWNTAKKRKVKLTFT
jgi:hypothetical protein